jgi:cell wall-associated NlpC family hydrolase
VTKELFFQVIMKMLFIPYRWSGDDPILGFDCSGGVQEILATMGLDPEGDQTAQQLYNHFLSRHTPREFGPGSLAFYGKSLTEITHIAIGISPKLIFEFGGGDARTIDEPSAARQNAYGRIRPLNRRRDLVAVLTPTDLPF